jgi:hypothetical protein
VAWDEVSAGGVAEGDGVSESVDRTDRKKSLKPSGQGGARVKHGCFGIGRHRLRPLPGL